MLVFVFYLVFAHLQAAQANSSFELDLEDGRFHVTADRTLYHSKEKVYEAFGHVVISGKRERLSADYAWIDTKAEELKAKGNVIYVTPESLTQAAEIHYNMKSQLGTIFYGRVSNDAYTLRGQLIRKISKDRFLTTDGEYTTCKDCPESWKFTAKNLDLTFDGYAFMDNVYIKVNDVPALYIPYMIVPVKSRRQTGLLFPKLSSGSTHGFTFVQPLFLAIDEHQDATLGLGKYSARGRRLEFEYRYKSYNDTQGTINAFHTKDQSIASLTSRWSVSTVNHLYLGKHADFRWRVFEVSDQEYPRTFVQDIKGDNDVSLESNAVLYSPFQDFFVAAEARRYRNLLYDKDVGFDGGTVQALPSVHFGVRERRILGPIFGNFYGRYDDFRRHDGAFYDANNDGTYEPNNDYLREVRRFQFVPELAAPFRVSDVFSISPSVQFQELQYFFNLPTESSDFSRTSQRFLLTKLDTSTVFEKVYQYNGERVIRVKHQLSPFVNYSYIPWIDENSKHPFQQQIRREGGLFDQFDIIPVTNSTNFLRLPLGNSLLYGFNSRVIRKFRSPDEMPKVYPYDRIKKKPKEYGKAKNRKQELSIEDLKIWDAYRPRYEEYQEIWHLSVSQAYDFKDAKNHREDKKRAFSFLQAKSALNIDDFGNTTEYRYYPRILKAATTTAPEELFANKHSISTATSWYWKRLRNSRGTRIFERGLTLSFSNYSQPFASRNISLGIDWSFNDFLRASYARGFDLLAKKLLNQSIRTTYSSPSECWQLGLRYTQTHNTGTEFGVDLGINLMGQGYVGVSQIGESSGGT